MAHHHHRRMVVAVDEQPWLIPDAERERAHRAGHSLAAQPVLGRRQQSMGARLVLGLEHPPLAKPRRHVLEHQSVDLGGDAADDTAIASGEEERRFGVLEPGILARGDQAVDLGLERRHPVGILPVEAIGELDERFFVGPGEDVSDLWSGHGRVW
jgi:hypothetical protein